MTRPVQAGFVSLVDAAPLIVAVENGFAAHEGISLRLSKQSSWACLRDHLNLGYIDCAQALAPLPVAAALGIGQVKTELAVPFVLSRGGNAITLSSVLADEIRAANGGAGPVGARSWARALAIAMRQRSNPITLAMVYPFSGHNFEIRYWLGSAGIHPDRDVRLIAIPPPLMVESLKAGQIDGFCVGAPWNSIAVAEGIGEIVAAKSELFPHGIEKVLTLPAHLLDDEPMIAGMLRALSAAAEWCDQPENHPALADLLSQPQYLSCSADVIRNVLSGCQGSPDSAPDKNYLYFSRNDANRPRHEEGLWIYAQMLRWGQVRANAETERTAARVYRPDVYARVFGAPEDNLARTVQSCDHVEFDGRSVSEYLQRFDVATPFGKTPQLV